MRLRAVLATLIALGLSSTPAFALFCVDDGPKAGIEFEFSTHRGIQLSQSNFQEQFDMARLREIGVYASSVERWNGCIRAFVDNGSGGKTMEFYDPATLRRVQ